ncbi:Atu4866 domain-containing protein [Nocardia sp. 2YAB30]|uniref:Atu4866 domain-containing protein n=1 Tax=unclassified Nocardia TaxID=2637762 RepID=UPI003F94A562
MESNRTVYAEGIVGMWVTADGYIRQELRADGRYDEHVTDPDASKLMADLIDQIDVLRSEDVAETVAFVAAVPKHVNLTEITILPTAQAI